MSIFLSSSISLILLAVSVYPENNGDYTFQSMNPICYPLFIFKRTIQQVGLTFEEI